VTFAKVSDIRFAKMADTRTDIQAEANEGTPLLCRNQSHIDDNDIDVVVPILALELLDKLTDDVQTEKEDAQKYIVFAEAQGSDAQNSRPSLVQRGAEACDKCASITVQTNDAGGSACLEGTLDVEGTQDAEGDQDVDENVQEVETAQDVMTPQEVKTRYRGPTRYLLNPIQYGVPVDEQRRRLIEERRELVEGRRDLIERRRQMIEMENDIAVNKQRRCYFWIGASFFGVAVLGAFVWIIMNVVSDNGSRRSRFGGIEGSVNGGKTGMVNDVIDGGRRIDMKNAKNLLSANRSPKKEDSHPVETNNVKAARSDASPSQENNWKFWKKAFWKNLWNRTPMGIKSLLLGVCIGLGIFFGARVYIWAQRESIIWDTIEKIVNLHENRQSLSSGQGFLERAASLENEVSLKTVINEMTLNLKKLGGQSASPGRSDTSIDEMSLYALPELFDRMKMGEPGESAAIEATYAEAIFGERHRRETHQTRGFRPSETPIDEKSARGVLPKILGDLKDRSNPNASPSIQQIASGSFNRLLWEINYGNEHDRRRRAEVSLSVSSAGLLNVSIVESEFLPPFIDFSGAPDIHQFLSIAFQADYGAIWKKRRTRFVLSAPGAGQWTAEPPTGTETETPSDDGVTAEVPSWLRAQSRISRNIPDLRPGMLHFSMSPQGNPRLILRVREYGW